MSRDLMKVLQPVVKEQSVMMQMITLPYRLAISSWLDILMRRPSSTWFTQAFESEFQWFMAKHDLHLAENGFFENVGQSLLNAKVVTLRSSFLMIKFVYLVNNYQIAVKVPGISRKWLGVADFLPEFRTPQQILEAYGVDVQNMSFTDTVQLIDRNWSRLEDAAGGSTINLTKAQN